MRKKIISVLFLCFFLFSIVTPTWASTAKEEYKNYINQQYDYTTIDDVSLKGKINIDTFALKTKKSDPQLDLFLSALNKATLDYDISMDFKNHNAKFLLAFKNDMYNLPLHFFITKDQVLVDLDSIKKIVSYFDPVVKDKFSKIPSTKKYVILVDKTDAGVSRMWDDMGKALKDAQPDPKALEALKELNRLFIDSLPDGIVKKFDDQMIGLEIKQENLIPILSSLIEIVKENPDKVKQYVKAMSGDPTKNFAIEKKEDLSPEKVSEALQKLSNEMNKSFYLNLLQMGGKYINKNQTEGFFTIDLNILEDKNRDFSGLIRVKSENSSKWNTPDREGLPQATNSNCITTEELDRLVSPK
ncbi:hypothetical protein H1S01_10595 [Heliobacterium chlorum]|uniref:DUF945 family protein n=1 Tax=Heliobacterium chlorum TaxID=2698 RepID=A0ABR7T547_HELCL|nr:hypothetical protein [Heliobacterium chlorum]MBC9784959.1 hypothetical protein [Heliobacterium chlorum]